jgi:acyl-coenzyme A thioesterase 13
MNPQIDISQVEGNASPEIKRAMQKRMQFLQTRRLSHLTGEEVRVVETSTRLRLVDVSILSKAQEPKKLEGHVIFEVIADGCTVVLP